MRMLLFFAIPLALCAQEARQADAKHGQKLFESYGCYQCHGHQGQGSSEGVRLGPKPIPLAAFVRYVRHPTNQMPPVTAKVVSDQDLADIHAFLQSIPAPPLAKDVPLLKNY